MPFFISEERLKESIDSQYHTGYQVGYSDGLREGERKTNEQYIQMGLQFRNEFEALLNEPQSPKYPSDFPALIDQFQDQLRKVKYRLKGAERDLENYKRENNSEAWIAMTFDLQTARRSILKMQEHLDTGTQQLDVARKQNIDLEGRICDLEKVIATLQNTLDRANNQGK